MCASILLLDSQLGSIDEWHNFLWSKASHVMKIRLTVEMLSWNHNARSCIGQFCLNFIRHKNSSSSRERLLCWWACWALVWHPLPLQSSILLEQSAKNADSFSKCSKSGRPVLNQQVCHRVLHDLWKNAVGYPLHCPALDSCASTVCSQRSSCPLALSRARFALHDPELVDVFLLTQKRAGLPTKLLCL